jgi:integrase
MSKLTATSFKHAKHTDKRQEIPDGAGLYLVLQPKPSTVRSWAYRYRHAGKSYKITLGTAVAAEPGFVPPPGALTLAMAREAAAVELKKREQGQNPAELRKPKIVTADTFETIARDCFQYARDKQGNPLRSAGRQIRDLERLAFPTLGRMPVASIRRRDIIQLLRKIDAEHGPVAGDGVFASISKVMNQYAIEEEEFKSPLVKRMRQSHARERDRILSDVELQAIWLAAEESKDTFPKLVQFLLCSAARSCEAGGMRRDEVKDGVWTCPPERSKTKVEIVRPLSALAQIVLSKTPRIAGDFIFTRDGKTPYANPSKDKLRFDAKCAVSGYAMHDLRRTARSLMARAGVLDEIAERCLAHAVKGVKKVYNRHDYLKEQALAYEKLAGLIKLIVYPQDNVAAFPVAS